MFQEKCVSEKQNIGGGEFVFGHVVNVANDLNIRARYPWNTGDAGYEGVTRFVVSGGAESLSGSVLDVSNADSVILLTRTAKYYTNCEDQWDQKFAALM